MVGAHAFLRGPQVGALTRRLLNFLAALSLLLCVAVCVLWARSYRVSDWLGRVHYTPGIPSEDHHVYLRSISGTVALVGGGDPPGNFSEVRWVWQRSEPWRYPLGPDGPPWLRALGVGWENERVLKTGETTWGAQVRLAWPASLPGLAGLLLALRGRKTRRSGGIPCPACGYDLTGNVGGVCPECGGGVRPGGPPEYSV